MLYNIESRKAIEIKNICRKLNIAYRDVEKKDYGYKLGYLLNISEDDFRSSGEDFDDEMLFLSEFGNGILDLFLALLRKKKCSVALNAVLTETNKEFTSYELFNEISNEHKAMQKGETYNQA